MGQSSPPPYPRYIFKQVSASNGGDHACGVIANESNDIVCWGNNDRGQSEMQKGECIIDILWIVENEVQECKSRAIQT